MRRLLLVALLAPALPLVSQAPTCRPTRPLIVDTAHAVLGVRVGFGGDSLEDRTLTRQFGDAMVAASFRVPGTISRAFYPGTGRGAPGPAGPRSSARLLTRVTASPPENGSPAGGYRVETPSEDPATDTVFVEALREAAAWVRPGELAPVRRSWHAELVVTELGDSSAHPLARLTIPAVRLERDAALKHLAMPMFPAEHRNRGEGGAVRMQYVVDEHGRVEPASVRVLSAPSRAFAMAARDAILASEYIPAMAGECPQKQLVQQTIRFTHTNRQRQTR